MPVELIIALVVIVLAALIYFNRSGTGLDVNNDGKVDIDDAKAAVENTVEGVKKEVAKATNRRGPGQTSAKTPAGKKPAVKAKTAGRGRNKKA